MKSVTVGVLLAAAAVCLAGCLGRPTFDREPVRLDAKWCSLGTSITWYNSHASGRFARGYQDRVLDRLDFAAFSNRGVNGGCIASAIKAVETADVYTVEHGVNDWGHGVTVGTMDDYLNDTGDRTFFGAYRKVVDRMRACNPKAAVVLCTPRKSYGFGKYLPSKWSEPNKGTYLEDYAKAVRAIAEHEDFEVADFFARCGEQEELASLSIDVALHPNDAGYARMADELVAAMVRAMEKRGLFVPSDRPADPAKAFTVLDAAGQVRQYVRPDGTVVTHNLTGADYRMADSYVIPAYGTRIDYNKKKGRKNSFDAGKGDAQPWTVPAMDSRRFADLARGVPLAKPARPRRVLVVAKAYGFSHTESLVWGTEAIRSAAAATGFARVDVTNDVSVLEHPEQLSRYDAVCLNNVTSVSAAKFPKLLETVTRYVEGGKGLCLIHSAVDSFNDSPGMQCLCGGHFGGHPWYYTGMWAFLNERPESFAMKTMPKGVSHYSDEIYEQQTPPFSRATSDVLLSLDLSDANTKAAADRWGASKVAERFPLRKDGDYAVSWTKRVGDGRVFYTSFGHDARAFFDPDRFGHILLGLQYCLGDAP